MLKKLKATQELTRKIGEKKNIVSYYFVIFPHCSRLQTLVKVFTGSTNTQT